LREGITKKVPQASPAGWTVRRYNNDGKIDAWTGDLGDTSVVSTPSGSTSYRYLTVNTPNDGDALMAYVLHRPCGAAEGGVWIGKDDSGGTPSTAPNAVSENTWLLEGPSYVVSGQTDAKVVDGSVQLTGKTLIRDGALCISSDVAERTEWTFRPTTKGSDSKNNNGDIIRPDTKPVWNLVTITSALKNNVYAGTPSGSQLVPGYFGSKDDTGSQNTLIVTMGGSEWVYNETTDGVVLSYRPRAAYRFESMTIPVEWIGKAMLIGNEEALPEEVVLERVKELKAKSSKDRWLTLGGRAVLEKKPNSSEYTGKIIFNVDFVEPNKTDDEGNAITFGALDSYVISLVIVDEPSAAQNTIEVAFGQGEVKPGAWLVTQTLFALNEDGTPNLSKGGDVVATPIWADEKGCVTLDANGDVVLDAETNLPVRKYADVHGWVYQPIVGDQLGMATVINPDLGLQGGAVANPLAQLTAENARLRPYLVWNVIPKSRVPANLFDPSLSEGAGIKRGDFIKNWGLNAWIGSPSILDGATTSLSDLRMKLKSAAESSALYADAGIIPMIYQGYCGEDEKPTKEPATEDSAAQLNLLSFRTMTAAELQAAMDQSGATGIHNSNPDALPYETFIKMSDDDPTIWKDGAILRFAVIIADATTDTVYDCQSISNFSSKNFDAYCPWYIPDATTNINRVTAAADAGGGVSPFAWVYEIPQGGVWINEFRPFAVYDGETRVVASAFELAMKASPLTENVGDGTFAQAPETFTPTRTLDGWKVITRYAPMPLKDADPTVPNEWQTHKEVPLHSWIPRRRVMHSLATSRKNPADYETAVYDLDFYAALSVVNPATETALVEASLSMGDSAYTAAYYKDVDGNTYDSSFQWLNFNLTNEALKEDADLFDADLQQELTADAEGPYADGVVYSIALVRNNGVVEDSVIFYKEAPNAGYFLEDRLALVLKREEANRTTAGVVRALTSTSLPDATYPQMPAQFLRFTNMNTNPVSEMLGWYVAFSDDRVNTSFSMPNEMELGFPGLYYTQPNLDGYKFKENFLTNFAAIEVHVTGGGGATLSLVANGKTAVGRNLTVTALKASGYELALQNWNQAWYAPPTITRDSVAFTPVNGYAVATTYNANGTRSSSVLIDSGLVTDDTLYNIVFNYTPEAQALKLPTEMSEGFVQWLQQVTPAEVALSEKVDLDEKYWLGVESPADDTVDPALAISNVGMYFESVDATEAKPTISVKLTNKGTLVTSLKEGGNVVLLGKQTLEGEWVYLHTLGAEDLAEDAELILSTDCKFFRAVLLSDAEVRAITTPAP
jgi:hypothetical protein